MSSSVFFRNSIDLKSVIDTIIKEGGYVGEIKSKKKSGEDIIVQISAYFLKPEDSTESCIYVSLVDVTERERIKEALASANMKLNILSGITRHDILNEVTVAIGYLDMMNDASQEEKDDFIKKIFIVYIIPAVPRDYEYGRGDYNTEKFSNSMKEQKTVKIRERDKNCEKKEGQEEYAVSFVYFQRIFFRQQLHL